MVVVVVMMVVVMGGGVLYSHCDLCRARPLPCGLYVAFLAAASACSSVAAAGSQACQYARSSVGILFVFWISEHATAYTRHCTSHLWTKVHAI